MQQRLHLVGILFPHINDDARSKSHQIYHSTCFGRGSRLSSGVINKTVMAATSVCQCVWGEVVLSLVVCVR